MSLLENKFAAQLRGDRLIWLVVGMLTLISLLAVYSASSSLAYRSGSSSEAFLIKHALLLLGGLVLMYISHRVNYMRYARLSVIFLVLAVPLLIYTMVFGTVINDAARWVRIPFVGLTFQPSDFAKIALIMYMARTLSLMQDRKVSFGELIVPVIVICGLIAPSDLSSSLILFVTGVMLMFIGRVRLMNVVSLIFLGIAAFTILIVLADYFPSVRVSTWQARLRDFLAGTGQRELTQAVQAKMAIAEGQVFGVGPGNGVQSSFLPHSYSDYIFCTIVEEYGLVGGVIVIGLYVLLLFRCVRLVTRSPKAFGAILALGLCLSLVMQAFAHMAVNVNLLPVTGLTLPLVSKGGSSLLFTSISLGIILSVSRFIESTQQKGD